MTQLDAVIDAIENRIVSGGVASIDLPEWIDSQAAYRSAAEEDKLQILVEVLRVWMEHQWQAGRKVTVQECLLEFPDVEFGEQAIADLRFEEQRLARQDWSSLTHAAEGRSIDELPQVGQRWSEFELVGLLGEGAFSKVYLAKQTGLAERFVALKLTFRKTSESQWLAMLQHSAIVPIYSTHRVGDVYGICMPYLGNTTLADVLNQIPGRTLKSTRQWWRRPTRKDQLAGQALMSTIRSRQQQMATAISKFASSQPASSQPASSQPDSVKFDSSRSESPSARSRSSGQVAMASDRSATSRLSIESVVAGQVGEVMACGLDDVEFAIWIGRNLADALNDAHRHGILHSDIKPANILLASDGLPRLLDFNVAFAELSKAASAPVGGTVAYMSPEHRRSLELGGAIDARSDIYSLGLVLFEMLTGRLPNRVDRFQSGPSREGAAVELNSNHSDPRIWNRAVSPAVASIVRKCIEADPIRRYSSAEHLMQDLQAQLLHRPLVHQPEPSWFERVQKWGRRHPRWSSSITIASIALLTVSIIAGAFVARGNALAKVEWNHRIDQLRQDLPQAMSLMTSLKIAPELEGEAAEAIDHSIELLLDGSRKSVDARWFSEPPSLAQDLIQPLRQLRTSAKLHAWSSPPKYLSMLLSKDLTTDPTEDEMAGGGDSLGSVLRGQFEQALERLTQKTASNPRDYYAWWLLGDSQAAVGDWEQADRAYTTCVALRPDVAMAYFNRAMVQYRRGHWKQADLDYQKTIELKPHWSRARFNRALVLFERREFEAALRELEWCERAGMESVSIDRLRAEIWAACNQPEASQRELLRALSRTPRTEAEWLDRGLIQLETNPRAARDDFLKAVEINPSSAAAHQKLAYVTAEVLGQPDQAMVHLDRLVDLDGTNPTHRAGRAVLLARAGRWRESLGDLAELNRSEIREGIVMFQVACAYSLVASHWKEVEKEDDPEWPANGRDDCLRQGLEWLVRALQRDSTLFNLVESDSDIAELKTTNAFASVIAAAKVIIPEAREEERQP